MTTAIVTQAQPINAGDYTLVNRSTDDERLVYLWLHSEKRANSPLTQESYARTWRQFSAFVGKPLQEIGIEDLLTWREHLTGKPATQKTKIATVRSLFTFAVKVGYLRMSPAVMLSSPADPSKKHRKVVTQGNIERLVEACITCREAALIRCLYSSGARISEALALQWHDVTPRDNGGAVLHILYGKGLKSRDAGINAATYRSLLALRAHDVKPTDYVFATRTGRPLDRQAANDVVKRVAKRAGLPTDISCHWMRHSHATHSLANGTPLANTMTQLGHASSATTASYLHADGYSSDNLAI